MSCEELTGASEFWESPSESNGPEDVASPELGRKGGVVLQELKEILNLDCQDSATVFSVCTVNGGV